jgi:glycosyltransferase involved in cell wall biosynthesis
MRIALVTIEYVTEPNFAGGLSNYTHKVALGLKELGHTPEVFVYGKSSEVFEHAGIRIERCPPQHNLKIRLLDRLARRLLKNSKEPFVEALGYSWGAEKFLRRRHSSSPFDLIHYTHLNGSGVFLRRSIPSVVRLSSFRDLWLEHGFVQNPAHIYGEDRSIRRAHGLISPSNWVGAYVSEKFARPVEVIESPFVPTARHPDDSIYRKHLTGITKYGLYFGSLTKYKGIYVLAESLKKFLEERPDYHFVFVGRDMYGDPGDPHWQRICRVVGRSQDRLHRLESLPHNQLFPIVEHAAFVALPSLADNLPNTALEAMATGKVVIGTDGRSFEQLIKDGISGYLCQPGDSESLLVAMRRASELSNVKAAAMGEKARARIDLLRPEIAVAKLVDFYREVIAAHPKNWSPKSGCRG